MVLTIPVSCRGWLLVAIIVVDSKGRTRLRRSPKLPGLSREAAQGIVYV